MAKIHSTVRRMVGIIKGSHVGIKRYLVLCCRNNVRVFGTIPGSFQIPVDSFSEPLAVIGWRSQP